MKSGPTVRAKAPRDLKIPITVPFWSSPPWFETMVVRHGTIVADENEYMASPTNTIA